MWSIPAPPGAARDGGQGRELLASQTNAVYAGGSLLHVHENNLMARPFSTDRLEFTGHAQSYSANSGQQTGLYRKRASGAGQPALLAESMLEGGGRQRVSTQGGVMPRWEDDMSGIDFVDASGSVIRTEIEPRQDSLVIGTSREVLRGGTLAQIRTFAHDAVRRHVLLQRPVQKRVSESIQLVTGW